MEIDHNLEQKLFDLSQKDYWIYKLIQVITYNNKTKNEMEDFLDFPSKHEVLDELEEYVEFISDIISNDHHTTKEDFFNLEDDGDKLTFVREEMLNELSREVCFMLGDDGDRKSDRIIEKELKNIKIDKTKSFLRNVNRNIISNNNIMKFFCATNFLSRLVSEREMENLDYDKVVDNVPSVVKLTYAKLMSADFGKDVSKDDIDLDKDYYEELTEDSVRDFVEYIIDRVRNANANFIRTITFRMIMFGRISIKKRRNENGEEGDTDI